MTDWSMWPGKTPLTPSTLQVLKCIFVVSESGRGADIDEVRDMLVLNGMTERTAEAAIADAMESGIISEGRA